MNATWLAFAGVLTPLLVGGLLWGADMNARLKALEQQIGPLRALAQSVSDNVIGIRADLKNLSRSVAWMGAPADPPHHLPRRAEIEEAG